MVETESIMGALGSSEAVKMCGILETMLWFRKLLQGQWEEGLGLRCGERHSGHSLRERRRDESHAREDQWEEGLGVLFLLGVRLLIVLGRVALILVWKQKKRQRKSYHAHKMRVVPSNHRWKTQEKWPQNLQGPSPFPAQRPKQQASQIHRRWDHQTDCPAFQIAAWGSSGRLVQPPAVADGWCSEPGKDGKPFFVLGFESHTIIPRHGPAPPRGSPSELGKGALETHTFVQKRRWESIPYRPIRAPYFGKLPWSSRREGELGIGRETCFNA